MLGAEGAEPGGVGEAGSGGGLHLDREDPTPHLHDQVHLLPGSRPPVRDLRAVVPRVSPAEQVEEDEVLEVRPARLLRPPEVEGEADVAQVELGPSDQALGTAQGEGREAHEEVGDLEEVEPAVHGRLGDPQAASEVGLVRDLAELDAHGAHQAAEVGEGRHRGEREKVPLEVRPNVALEPDGAIGGGAEAKGRDGEAAPARERTPVLVRRVVAPQELGPVALVGRDEVLPAPAPSEAALLPPRHRPQGEVAGAAGERLRDAAHQQEVGGPREEEGAPAPPPVHGALHREEQVRGALDLVQGDGRPVLDEAVGIAAREVEGIEVVQGHEPALARHEVLRERALARLPGAGHDDHGHRAQVRLQGPLRVSGDEREIIHAVNDIHSRRR
ncbi:hypothetical protein HRbin12_01886 [bacterium HR12]|nr:hypothetical protein HRbin12_01886 [bacterium HR12]